MQQDPLAKKRHLEFVKTIVKKGKVYSIENEEGIASADAMLFETEEGQPKGMIFFWSEKRLAQAQCTAEWSTYEPKEIKLSDFLENVCIGLYTDKHIIGTNFDSELIGYEIEPLELILECLTKLRKAGSSLTLQRYESISIFEQLVREHLANYLRY